jgi:hypothetical protein
MLSGHQHKADNCELSDVSDFFTDMSAAVRAVRDLGNALGYPLAVISS